MKIATFALTAAMLVAPAMMNAQGMDHHNNIAQRKANQQRRIDQGVRSGELTRYETSHLERQERGINHEERAMRAQDNGRLTGYDRNTIRRQQNAESRRIYRDKHNDRVN